MRPHGHTRLRLGLESLEGRVVPSGTPIPFAVRDDSPQPLAQHRDFHDATSFGYAAGPGRPFDGPAAAPHDPLAAGPAREAGVREFTVVTIYVIGRYEFINVSRIDIGPAYGAPDGPYGAQPGNPSGEGPGAADHPPAVGDPPAASSGHARVQPVSTAPAADPSLAARASRPAPVTGSEPAPGTTPVPLPVASRDAALPEQRLAQTRPGGSLGATLPTDLRLDVPLPLGRGDLAPTPLQRNGGAEADAAVEEAPSGAGAAQETPKAGAGAEAPLPAEGAGLLVEGLPSGLTALERALRALTEAEPLSARRGMTLLHWLGASTWMLAAGAAYAVARRRRTRPAGDLVAEEPL
jgi:hypothetical protein